MLESLPPLIFMLTPLMFGHWTWTTVEERIIITSCGLLRTPRAVQLHIYLYQGRTNEEKVSEKVRYLASFGNTSQQSRVLIDPNFILGRRILPRCLLVIWLTDVMKHELRLFTRQHHIMLLFWRPSDPFIAGWDHREMSLFWGHTNVVYGSRHD